jgi:phage-related protein
MAKRFYDKYVKTLKTSDSFMKKFMMNMTYKFLNNTFVKIAMKAFDNVKMYARNLFHEVLGELNQYFDLIISVVGSFKDLGKAAMSWIGGMAKGIWGKITGKKPDEALEEESQISPKTLDINLKSHAKEVTSSLDIQSLKMSNSMMQAVMFLAEKDESVRKELEKGIIEGMQEETKRLIGSNIELDSKQDKRAKRQQKPKEKEGIWATIMAALMALAGWLWKWVVKAWKLLKVVFGTLWGWIEKLWKGIKWVLGKTWGLLKKVFGGIKSIALKAWVWIKGIFGGIWDDIAKIAGRAWKYIKGIFGGLWDDIVGISGRAWKYIKGIFGGLWDDIVGISGRAWKYIKGIFGGMWDDIATKAGGAWKYIRGIFGGMWDDIVAKSANAWKYIKGIFGGIWDDIIGWSGKIKGIFKGPAFEAIFGFFGKIGSAIKGAFSGAAGKIIDWVVGIWGKISKLFTVVGEGGGWVAKVLGVAGRFGGLMKYIPIIGWVITGIMGIIDFFKGFDAGKAESIFGGSGLIAKIMSGLSYVVSGLTMGLVSPETIGKILKTVTEVVIGIVDKIVWFYEQLWAGFKWIYEKLSDAGAWFIGIIPKIWEGIKTVIDYTYGLPLKILNLIFPGVEDAVKGFFYKMGDALIDVLKGLWDWIKDKAKNIPVIGSLFGGENKPGEKGVWEKAKEMASAGYGALTTNVSETGKSLIGEKASGIWGGKTPPADAKPGETPEGYQKRTGKRISPEDAGAAPRTAGAPAVRAADAELARIEAAPPKGAGIPTPGTEAAKRTTVNVAPTPPVVMAAPQSAVQEAPSMLSSAANALMLQNYY